MLREITKEGNALLQTIRGSESSMTDKAYTMRFGGTFSDLSKHPRVFERVPWRKDGKKSSAAGAYQITATTWDRLRAKFGFTDFSPQTQDRAAWYLAQDDYKRRTGSDLQNDLEQGKLAKVFKALAPTWTSLPSGAEQNKATKSAFSRYEENLKKLKG